MYETEQCVFFQKGCVFGPVLLLHGLVPTTLIYDAEIDVCRRLCGNCVSGYRVYHRCLSHGVKSTLFIQWVCCVLRAD